MLLQLIKQASVQGFTASTVATARIPTSGRHYALFFRCLTSGSVDATVAQIKTAIGNMVVRLNGTQIIEATSTFLLDLQKFYGDCTGAGNVAAVIPIFFAPFHLPNFVERQIYAIGTQDLQSFTVDMNVLSTASVASVDVYSFVSPEIAPVGQHIRIKKYPRSFASTGDDEVTTLPLEGAGVAYKALHIEAGSGTFNNVTVKVGGNNIFDQVPPSLNQVLLNRSGRTPQTGYYHVAFDVNNDLTSLLLMQGIQDFRTVINWKTAAPTNYNIYAEEIFGLNVVNK